MGILKASGQKARADIPWTMPGGIYPSDVFKVEISQGDGPRATYTFLFTIDAKACSELLSKEKRCPLDLPAAKDIKHSFDTNNEDEKIALFGLIGIPRKDMPTNSTMWDDSGLIQWNGKTDDTAKFSGQVELTIAVARPSRARTEGGFWNPQYRIDDINPIGTMDKAAQLAMEDLIDPEPEPEPEPVKGKAKGKAKGK